MARLHPFTHQLFCVTAEDYAPCLLIMSVAFVRKRSIHDPLFIETADRFHFFKTATFFHDAIIRYWYYTELMLTRLLTA